MALDKKDRANFMQDIGMKKTGLSKLIKEGYDLLNLETFFTSGPEESRAWTIKKYSCTRSSSSNSYRFSKNFIRAEAIDCGDFFLNLEAQKSVKKMEK